jgi:hypothetical protein
MAQVKLALLTTPIIPLKWWVYHVPLANLLTSLCISLYKASISFTKQNKTKHIHDELLAYVPLGEIYQPQPRTILPALALRELWQIVGAV